MSKIVQFGAERGEAFKTYTKSKMRKPRAIISVYNVQHAKNPLVEEYIEIDPFTPSEWRRLGNIAAQLSAEVEDELQNGDRVQSVFERWILGSGDDAEYLIESDKPYDVFFRVLEPTDGVGAIMPDGSFFLKINPEAIRQKAMEILGSDKF